MGRPRILLADDHTLVVEGFRKLLEPEFEIVGVASDGRALLAAALQHKPDVIILDTELPDLTGLEACRLFRGEPHIGRNVPILMLTSGPPTPEQRVTALRAGVWDFLRYAGDADDDGRSGES